MLWKKIPVEHKCQELVMVYTNCPWSHWSVLKEFLEELLYIPHVAIFEAMSLAENSLRVEAL